MWKTLAQASLATMLAALVVACDAADGVLDLATLQARIPEGTLQAERVPGSHVGVVDGDLLIAVALLDSEGDERDVMVYLCDGADVAIWMRGPITGDDVELAANGSCVELSLGEDVITGSVVVVGGEPQSFRAERAEGDAGLYRSEGEFARGRYVGGWIVLASGLQAGAVAF